MATPQPRTLTHDRQLRVRQVLDALLRCAWPTDEQPGRPHLDIDLAQNRPRYQAFEHTVAEACLDLNDDDEALILQSLGSDLGPGVELVTTHRRVRRWMVGGHEVRLDSYNGKRLCVRIVRRADCDAGDDATDSP